METSRVAFGWIKIDADSRRMIRWTAPLMWVFLAIDLIHSVSTGNAGHFATAAGCLAIFSSTMVGPHCYGIVEAKPGSNSQKALVIIFLFSFLLMTAGLIAQLLALWR